MNNNSIQEDTIKKNLETIHTTTINTYLTSRAPNNIINQLPPDVNKAELSRPIRTLVQLRTNKFPFLVEYKHKIEPQVTPSPLCTLCRTNVHNTQHLFNCPKISTQLDTKDLWENQIEAAALLAKWAPKLALAYDDVITLHVKVNIDISFKISLSILYS